MNAHRAIREAISTLLDDIVDPREAYLGDDGRVWSAIGDHHERHADGGITSENQLDEIRAQCRSLAVTNEFAINGHENRISYVVGTGHSYRAIPKDTEKLGERDARLAEDAQDVIDEFTEANRWANRQQEIMRRLDRDGECFLRYFPTPDALLVRFVEPNQISTPTAHANDPSHAMGIHTDENDVETPVGFWVDGQLVDAQEIQHRKANVDSNVRRGLPLFYPVRKNLRRAEKLLRNMSATAEIQTAIGLIRRHEGMGQTAAQSFIQSQADYSHTDQSTGRTTYYRRLGPGTVIDAPRGISYEFPASGINAAAFTEVLRAELRAIAARLVMPEYMFTSDVSSSNYASTIAASGPSYKMFERTAATMRADDRAILHRAIAHAVDQGRLPPNVLKRITINIRLPPLVTKDPLQEARVNEIAHKNGILSPQTWSQKLDLDYDQEQTNIKAHAQTTEPPEVPHANNGRPQTGFDRPVLRSQ